MKVKQLIKQLQKLDPDALVVLSSDAEGNHYSFLSDVSHETFFSEKDDMFYDFDDKDKSKDAKLSVVFYPKG